MDLLLFVVARVSVSRSYYILKKRKGILELKLKKGKVTNIDQVTEATAVMVILSADTGMQAIDMEKLKKI